MRATFNFFLSAVYFSRPTVLPSYKKSVPTQ
ncbi:TPA_asm: hypothetical protein [Porphyromonas phage phage017a_JCVISC001]|uniref:Uncharacterized protein n=1 Tax=Porphyromonas phage phage017a_JCVISC001 TaxID=3154107 RepID=A0AAT9JJK3_9CAUD